MQLNAKWYEGLAGMDQLRSDWYKLTPCAHLFARYEWHYAATANFTGDNRSVLFCRISDEADEPLAIIPALPAKTHIRPFGEIQALTLDWDSQLVTFDFPLAHRADASAVAETMLRAFKEREGSWQVISWPRVMADSNAARLAIGLGRKGADYRPASVCNVFYTGNNPDAAKGYEIYTVKSGNLRHSLASRTRRLSKEGQIQMRMAREEGDIEGFFVEFLRLESSGWKGKDGLGTAVALVPSARAFYRTLLEISNRDFEADIALLYWGEKAIAGQFLIRVARWEHIYKIGFDEDFSAFSPGQILNQLVIEHAKASSCIDFVSLVTGLEWHKKWDPIPEPTLNVSIFRSNWRLYLVVMARQVRSWLARRTTKDA